MKYILIWMIKLYQKIPGDWHYSCKFQPTCSSYAIQAIEKYGSIKGCFLTIKRLIRCRPGTPGAYDPVP